VRRRRANFGHDPRLTACREVARTHQGLHGGHPGDLHAAPPVSCVSASSRTSPVNSFYLPVHTSCAEGMHMSPAARGVNIGTRRKVPGHTAHSAARILHFRPLRGQREASAATHKCISCTQWHATWTWSRHDMVNGHVVMHAQLLLYFAVV